MNREDLKTGRPVLLVGGGFVLLLAVLGCMGLFYLMMPNPPPPPPAPAPAWGPMGSLQPKHRPSVPLGLLPAMEKEFDKTHQRLIGKWTARLPDNVETTLQFIGDGRLELTQIRAGQQQVVMSSGLWNIAEDDGKKAKMRHFAADADAEATFHDLIWDGADGFRIQSERDEVTKLPIDIAGASLDGVTFRRRRD